MALAYLLPIWPVDLWVDAMRRLDPARDIRVWPDGLGRLEDIRYVVCWRPPPGVARSFPNLEAIFNLGAGVDAILADDTLPIHVPIVRVNDSDLTTRMTEYVVLQVLMHHRQQRRTDFNQQSKLWDPFITHAATDLAVGIMGLGVMGAASAEILRDIGFKVAGWSRTRKKVPGVHCYAGAAEFDSFLRRTDLLVCLLPYTPETHGILNRETLRKLSRHGPFGAPILINAGRGRQQVENDILAALDAGELHAATLDVFETEPLPPESPLWSHPRVTVTPHFAADSDPETISRYVLGQIRRHEHGLPLENVVDRTLGY
jgi:glyoxylate/hydroxypyruvate reductase A